MKHKRLSSPIPKPQQGVTLIVALVVLLVLTLLGVASTDSGNIQSIMARNSQFRIEAFNASNTEIEAKIDSYESVAVGTVPPDLNRALDSGLNVTLSSKDNPQLISTQSNNDLFIKEVSITHSGGCPLYLNSIGAGSKSNKCYLLTLESDVKHNQINISSNQVQTFSYIAK